MTRPLSIIAITSCVILVGCTQTGLITRFTPPDKERLARSYIDLLIQGNFPEIESQLDPAIVGPDTQGTLAKMSAMFPPETPKSVKVVGVNLYDEQGYSQTNLTFEYEFTRKWLLVNVDIQKKGTAATIAGLHVEPMSESLEETHAFTLRRKSVTQYSILFAAVTVVLFSFYVLVLCVQTRHVGRKWLWIIFILVGFCKLTVNWTSGELHFRPIA
jgi:hypothetical protein